MSKDGTWKVFNTAIEYLKGQDADVIMSGSYGDSLDTSRRVMITLSPDGKLVALSQDKLVNLYSVLTGALVASIEEPHTQTITRVLFSSDCQYLFTSGDKHIRIFHNVPGIKNNIQVKINMMRT